MAMPLRAPSYTDLARVEGLPDCHSGRPTTIPVHSANHRMTGLGIELDEDQLDRFRRDRRA